MMTQPLTARNASMVSCHRCHLVCQIPPGGNLSEMACSRCGAALHQRKPDSITRTWALVIAAIAFYIPAMVLPISVTTTLAGAQGDTIMSGVIYFIHSGSWEIALVIFVASIMVPILKIMILIFLLISVQLKSTWRPLDSTRLYRIIEVIGKWSMVDIYVITLMAALIKLGGLASFDAGPAAVYFGTMVVITMFAAISFDPRLIWDCTEEKHESRK
ncbi:MAG: paraquat-inducible membrane protein A [Deltaproteobacteria bacterium]|nr:MAG: paraquat-inducible membrane protein A [Deltaproteobacteria bacterium]RLC10660.1 MAG: paraquat-inducible membrane protein A [Deltaproteobacteria bacterium]